MANPPSSRDRVLTHGLDLLSQAGLAGVTLGALADRAGLSKSGLFAHFRSKEQLQLELLDRMVELAQVHVVAPVMKQADGLPRLTALVRAWLGWSTRAGLAGGCPLAAALFELDDLEGAVRARVVELDATWRELLAGVARAAVRQGELRQDTDVDQLVFELCGLYLAHHSFRRLARAPDADARALAAYDALIAHFATESRR